MQSDYKEKYEQFVSWYQRMFHTTTTPTFEVNIRTLHLLHQLMHFHETNTKLQETALELLETQIKEYKNVNNSFPFEFISKQVLCFPSANIMLDTLSSVSNELSVRDPTNINHLYNNMSELLDELDETQDERRRTKQQFQKVKQTSNELIQRRNHLQKVQVELGSNEEQQNILMEHKKSQIQDYFEPKQFDYEQQQMQAKSHLNSIGLPVNSVFETIHEDASVSPNCRHENLVKLDAKIEQVKVEKWEPLRKQVATFFDLPTDLNLVKAVIEDKKQYLEQLENEIQEKLNFLEN